VSCFVLGSGVVLGGVGVAVETWNRMKRPGGFLPLWHCAVSSCAPVGEGCPVAEGGKGAFVRVATVETSCLIGRGTAGSPTDVVCVFFDLVGFCEKQCELLRCDIGEPYLCLA